ncbi:MAG: hypothetical protein Q7S65_03460 [Nanoarchaeota archaeon]|nr:hypothetical protein [Nanoarchaeota archaeon]
MGINVLIVEDGGPTVKLGSALHTGDLEKAIARARRPDGTYALPSDDGDSLDFRLYQSFPDRLLPQLGPEFSEVRVLRNWLFGKPEHHSFVSGGDHHKPFNLSDYQVIICDLSVPTRYIPNPGRIAHYLERQRPALKALRAYFAGVVPAEGLVMNLDHLLDPKWDSHWRFLANHPKARGVTSESALFDGSWQTFWDTFIEKWKERAGFYAVMTDVRNHYYQQGEGGTLPHVLLYTSDYRHALFTLPVAALFNFLTPDEIIRTHQERRRLRNLQQADYETLHFSESGRLAVGPKSPREVKDAPSSSYYRGAVSELAAFENWVKVVHYATERQLGRSYRLPS